MCGKSKRKPNICWLSARKKNWCLLFFVCCDVAKSDSYLDSIFHALGTSNPKCEWLFWFWIVTLVLGRPGCQVPQLVHSENIHSRTLLLRKEYAWHIGGALSLQELEEWKLLYHSSANGLSFSTFLGHVSWVTCFVLAIIW